MVPAHFLVLNEFPLTPNGKVDRRRLPELETSQPTRAPSEGPRNTDEQGLVEIWQEVLALNRVGIDDNFFELGGDSLSATRAFARINKAFGMDLSLAEILEHPTIRLQAKLVAQFKGTAPGRKPLIRRQPRALTRA